MIYGPDGHPISSAGDALLTPFKPIDVSKSFLQLSRLSFDPVTGHVGMNNRLGQFIDDGLLNSDAIEITATGKMKLRNTKYRDDCVIVTNKQGEIAYVCSQPIAVDYPYFDFAWGYDNMRVGKYAEIDEKFRQKVLTPELDKKGHQLAVSFEEYENGIDIEAANLVYNPVPIIIVNRSGWRIILERNAGEYIEFCEDKEQTNCVFTWTVKKEYKL